MSEVLESAAMPMIGVEGFSLSAPLATGYELESAISQTVDLVKHAEGFLAERLSRHLDDLLALQLQSLARIDHAPLIGQG
ncbi:hypothetical protein [Pseudomonas sp. PvP001]|uniref:hypothetical protein n=1 Tax=Pseudomonas sp. PvP001 TaxID=3158559 RepID=UPI003396F8CE